MNRREWLGLSDGAACRVTPVPNVVVTTHEGRRALFHDDLARGRIVLVQFASLADDAGYPVLENVARVQTLLGDRLGRDVHICTITTDPRGVSPTRCSASVRSRAGGS